MARGARRKSTWYDAFLDVGIWILFVLLLIPAGAVGYVIGKDQANDEPATTEQAQSGDGAAAQTGIESAPAFSADELTAEPKDAWLTNGGTLSNQRYSPLDEIDADNVKDLKGVWMTDLNGSGVAAKYSAEGQPIVYEGTMYIPTGADDVFAVDVASGKILWEYQAHLEQTISTVCCGWLSRGVALGDGKVYIGRLDGKLVALDQQTGKVAWETVVGRWQDGFTLAPRRLLRRHGDRGRLRRRVLARGRVTAYDTKTGKQKWKFWTIPGPGETGRRHLPGTPTPGRQVALRSGGRTAVDPELGLLYFSTGNAAPDLNGSMRGGRQPVHGVDRGGRHEDGRVQVALPGSSPRHLGLRRPEPGRPLRRHGRRGSPRPRGRPAGSTSSTVRPANRSSDPEQPVPQLASQKTAKTQPIPSYPPFIPQKVTADNVQNVSELKLNGPAKNLPVKPAKEMYTPFDDKAITVVVPGPQGGTNWQPTSYNPETEMFYVWRRPRSRAWCSRTKPCRRTSKARSPTSAARS